MTALGKFRYRLEIQRMKRDGDDERLGPWIVVDTYWAAMTALKGGEEVMGERLQGLQPWAIAMRLDELTKAVDNAYRLVDEDSRQVYRIKSALPTDDQQERQFLAVAKFGDRDEPVSSPGV